MEAPLYKYMPAGYVRSFMEGWVLLRRADEFGEQSGIFTPAQADDEMRRTQTFDDPRLMISWQTKDMPQPEFVPAKRCDITERMQHPYWLWCASFALDPALAWDFKADAVVRIPRPLGFMARMHEAAMHHFVGEPDIRGGPVSYDFQAGERAVYRTKHPSYQRQREYRMVLLGRDIKPRGGGADACMTLLHMGSNAHCSVALLRHQPPYIFNDWLAGRAKKSA